MQIPTAEQMRAWDAFTMEREPIASIDLMERAAEVFFRWFVAHYRDRQRPVYVFTGTGNNGGDGVAVARRLHQDGYDVYLVVCTFNHRQSPDFQEQIRRLPQHSAIEVKWLHSPEEMPAVPPGAVVIDALFGTGLSRPLEGVWADMVQRINALPVERVAIDLPSGLFADQPTTGACIYANKTFCFETPRKAFFFPENAHRVGEWFFESIGLHADFWKENTSLDHYLTREHVASIVKRRPRFSHKGTYGHALLIGGRKGSMGAAVLAARACLRSGVGLLTVHLPRCGYEIMQISAPEAMCSIDTSEECWTSLPPVEPFAAIGAGCGIGQSPATAQILKRLLQTAGVPLVLDADALNLLAQHSRWLSSLPAHAILTPHPKEFERLFGPTADSFARNARQREQAVALGVYIILKGAYTCIACPDGSCWFNSSGNPGMATGGSGDVLTGILTGLLAQGYSAKEACLLGVYLHGLAGDLAAEARSQPGMVAGDLVEYLGEVWKIFAPPKSDR